LSWFFPSLGGKTGKPARRDQDKGKGKDKSGPVKTPDKPPEILKKVGVGRVVTQEPETAPQAPGGGEWSDDPVVSDSGSGDSDVGAGADPADHRQTAPASSKKPASVKTAPVTDGSGASTRAGSKSGAVGQRISQMTKALGQGRDFGALGGGKGGVFHGAGRLASAAAGPRDPAEPKDGHDLALASGGGFKGAFDSMGLRAVDGAGGPAILRRDGSPASSAETRASSFPT